MRLNSQGPSMPRVFPPFSPMNHISCGSLWICVETYGLYRYSPSLRFCWCIQYLYVHVYLCISPYTYVYLHVGIYIIVWTTHHHYLGDSPSSPKTPFFVRAATSWWLVSETSFFTPSSPRKTQGHPNGFGGNLGIRTSKRERLGFITPFPKMIRMVLLFKSHLPCISIIPINLPDIYSVVFKKSLYLLKGFPIPRDSLGYLSELFIWEWGKPISCLVGWS